MKKFICILLAAMMIFAMAACGAPAKNETSAQQTTEEEEVQADEMLGEKSENHYANKALGIQADFPENWSILSEEETAQVLGVASESFSDEDLAKQLQESGSLYDLYAMAMDQSGDNVNVVIENLGVIYGIVIDEEKYLELAEEQLENSLSQMGVTGAKLEKQSYSFAGADRLSVLITGSYSGVPIYERMILIKAGKFMGLITAFSLDEARLDEIMGRFAAYAG